MFYTLKPVLVALSWTKFQGHESVMVVKLQSVFNLYFSLMIFKVLFMTETYWLKSTVCSFLLHRGNLHIC